RPCELLPDVPGQVRARHVGLPEEDERLRPGMDLEPLADLDGRVPVAPANQPEPAARRRIGGDHRHRSLLRGSEKAPVAFPRIAPLALVADPPAQRFFTD